jgi:hypothetical protein
MIKPIKFDLKLSNGETLYTFDDLKNNLTIELFEHFHSGKLAKWLRVRKLDELADKMEALNASEKEHQVQLFKNLCEVFGRDLNENEAREMMQNYKKLNSPLENSDGEEVEQLKAENEALKNEIEKLKNPSKPKIAEERIGQFIVYDDNTVLDTKTGLTWSRYAVGQGLKDGAIFGEPLRMSWADALKSTNNFNIIKFGGFDDWHLPTFDELKSILKIGSSPAIDLKIFPKTPIEKWDYFFWSSDSNGNLNARVVCFKEGNTGSIPKNDTAYIFLVRN